MSEPLTRLNRLIRALTAQQRRHHRVGAGDLSWLGAVQFEPSCVIKPDDSDVVRHARPLTAEDVAALREQAIARLRRDDAAVAARERRIAIARAPAGKVVRWRTI